MSIYPAFKKSFFLRFLCITIFLGNAYIALEAFFHSMNVHVLDGWLRFYSFKAQGIYYVPLLAGALLTFIGACLLWSRGPSFFKLYLWGKATTTLAYLILVYHEYSVSSLPFPWILIPLLLLIESIYPILLYVSIRHISKKEK